MYAFVQNNQVVYCRFIYYIVFCLSLKRNIKKQTTVIRADVLAGNQWKRMLEKHKVTEGLE